MAGLADGEHCVEMDVGLHERGSDERAIQVDHLACFRLRGHDPALPDAQVLKARCTRQPPLAEEQIEHCRGG
jgi:hypothetical protein